MSLIQLYIFIHTEDKFANNKLSRWKKMVLVCT